MGVIYCITRCPRCEGYDFSYFNDSPQRYCKIKKCFIAEQTGNNLRIPVGCKEYEKAKKGKAQYLDENTFKMRYLK